MLIMQTADLCDFPLLCRNSRAVALAQPGLMAGSLADEMLLHLEILKL